MPRFLNSIFFHSSRNALAFETQQFLCHQCLKQVRGAASEGQRHYKISATLGGFTKLGGVWLSTNPRFLPTAPIIQTP